MLISKNIQIEFANSSIKAMDAIHDIREGVRSASLNLYSRYMECQLRCFIWIWSGWASKRQIDFIM